MLAATFALLVIVLFDLWSGGFVRAEARQATAFLWKSVSSTLRSIANTGFLSSRRKLAGENASLRAQLEALEARLGTEAVLVEENKTLRSILAVVERESGITAPIVSSYRTSPYGTFLIGAGKSAGVAHGDLVLAPNGFVIGVVMDASERHSLVTALFAPGNSISALVSGVAILLDGSGGENARAEAPRDAKISSGDLVLAPEYGGRPVGIVGEVRSESGDASKLVYVRLPVNLASLRFVYIVQP